MAAKARSCSTRVTALQIPENTQPQAFRFKTLRSRNAPVTRRGLEVPQVVLVIASEDFHRTSIRTLFTYRNGSKTTTYVGVEGFPTKPAVPMPIPPLFDREITPRPVTGLDLTDGKHKTLVK